MPTDGLRIALLHLAPRAGDLAYNQRLVEQAITLAAQAGAQWVITPEVVTSGYTFAEVIGTDWIAVQPDATLERIRALARRHKVTIFLGHAERDATTNALHNSVFTISETGALLPPHRKINTLRIGSEAWSTPGVATTLVEVAPIGNIGLLICADAYSPGIAADLKARGAQAFVSSAAWAPGFHGPNGEWERISLETGSPVFVCNRTGEDSLMSFSRGESVVAHGGRRLLSLSAERSTVFVVDWDVGGERLRSPEPLRLALPEP
jgi:predicted amidohydrolase